MCWSNQGSFQEEVGLKQVPQGGWDAEHGEQIRLPKLRAQATLRLEVRHTQREGGALGQRPRWVRINLEGDSQ